VDDLFKQPDDATPLTPEEQRELIPAHIAYRSELNEAEQENIARAQDWALKRRRDLLSEKFITGLHRRCSAMYGAGRESSGRANAISGFRSTKSLWLCASCSMT
jgi:hypothetical protein